MRSALLVFLGCYYLSFCTSSEDLEESFVFHEPQVQKYFISRLDEEQLPYRISDDGQVWYPYSKKSQVGSIRQEVLKEYYPVNSVEFTQEWQYEETIRQFEERGINYRLIEVGESKKIAWTVEEDDEAREVIIYVGDKYRRQLTEKYEE